MCDVIFSYIDFIGGRIQMIENISKSTSDTAFAKKHILDHLRVTAFRFRGF